MSTRSASFLADDLPEPLPPTVVHGDYRLGNMMVAPGEPTRSPPCSTGRWARSATPAPTSATSSRPTASRAAGRARSARRPSLRSPASRAAPSSSTRYAERSGREVEPLAWFEALALWKAAVFCEAIYGRFIRGELGAEDTRAAIFEVAVPLLAETAAQAIA